MDQQLDKIVAEAGKLGKLISQTPASRAFLAHREKLDKDTEAMRIVEDYQKQLQKIAELERGGKPVEPEDKHKLTDLQQRMASNETLKGWMKAQADFSELMGKVNKAIAEPFQDRLAAGEAEAPGHDRKGVA